MFQIPTDPSERTSISIQLSAALAAILLFLMVTPVASPRPARAGEQDVVLAALFREYREGWFQQRPSDATRLGDRRVDDRLDDVACPARTRWQAYDRRTLKRLPQQVNYAVLDEGIQSSAHHRQAENESLMKRQHAGRRHCQSSFLSGPRTGHVDSRLKHPLLGQEQRPVRVANDVPRRFAEDASQQQVSRAVADDRQVSSPFCRIGKQ
ncbi:MAG: hypothetical protein MUE50_22900, partial [Pirellulaceae bacterium]|nr:hypothetical protein [Pirellulaceae bacterium]